MRQTTAEPISDQEFARQVGIVADLRRPLPVWRILLLALVLLLAGFATTFGVLFASSSTATGDNFQTATTQCPMTGNTPKPAR